jgi:hypothetical protein
MACCIVLRTPERRHCSLTNLPDNFLNATNGLLPQK